MTTTPSARPPENALKPDLAPASAYILFLAGRIAQALVVRIRARHHNSRRHTKQLMASLAPDRAEDHSLRAMPAPTIYLIRLRPQWRALRQARSFRPCFRRSPKTPRLHFDTARDTLVVPFCAPRSRTYHNDTHQDQSSAFGDHSPARARFRRRTRPIDGNADPTTEPRQAERPALYARGALLLF